MMLIGAMKRVKPKQISAFLLHPSSFRSSHQLEYQSGIVSSRSSRVSLAHRALANLNTKQVNNPAEHTQSANTSLMNQGLKKMCFDFFVKTNFFFLISWMRIFIAHLFID